MTYQSKNNENEKHSCCQGCPINDNNCKEQLNDNMEDIQVYSPQDLVEKGKINWEKSKTPKYTSRQLDRIVITKDQISNHINIKFDTKKIKTILDSFYRIIKNIEKEFKPYFDQEKKEDFTCRLRSHDLFDKVINIITQNYVDNIKNCFSYSDKDLIIDNSDNETKPTKANKIDRVGKKPEFQTEEEYDEMISNLKSEMDRKIEKKEKKINELRPIVEEGMKEAHAENIKDFEQEYLNLKQELDEKAKTKFNEEEIAILTKLTDEEKREILKRKL